MAKARVGMTVIRKEACDKVTGDAKYTNDYLSVGILTAKIVTSTYAHAIIKSVDYSMAVTLPGVRAVLTGEGLSVLCGSLISDRPPLASEVVLYYGEPIALVVADDEFTASQAVTQIKVTYEPLPIVSSPSFALQPGAPVLHKNLADYKRLVEDVYPEPGTNICHREQIRKGDIQKGFSECDVVIEGQFTLPMSDHIAMETRSAQARIAADGSVYIRTSSQGPHNVKKLLSEFFHLEEGKVHVEVPLVGGGFGGKSAVQLEVLAYVASKAVDGRAVRITNTRENDMASSPGRMGLEATVKLGASQDGFIKAVQMTFLVDTGAYSDIGPRLTKAIAVDCTGPYNIENVWCDSLCIYTNHPYITAFRGFGHSCLTFCMERMIDKLARKLGMNASQLRILNALMPGHTSPSQVKVTSSNFGNLTSCIEQLKAMVNWDEGDRLEIGGDKVRAKGMACIWKTSVSPSDASSGVFLHFNSDGSININCGGVECGSGIKTTAAQILSEKLKMDINRIYANLTVNTEYTPKHWKTVASMTTYMIGRALLRAAEDVIHQLKELATAVLKCPYEDLEVADERVYLKSDPDVYLSFKELVHGYKFPNGNSIGGPIIGRGSFIMGDINVIDRATGKGKAGPYWTVGAQAVEIEYDKQEYTYRFIKTATVIDAGKVLNPAIAQGLIKGGMCMGLGLGSREAFEYDNCGKVLNTSLRTYKVMHFGETPQYLVGFVETPLIGAPYEARGLAEHGIVGIPAALGNALSVAAETELDTLPLTSETVWRAKTGGIA